MRPYLFGSIAAFALTIVLMSAYALPPAPLRVLEEPVRSPVVEVQPSGDREAAPKTAPEETSAIAYYSVTEVIDGDTLRVRDGDTMVTVRLIGIDAPELQSRDKEARCFADRARVALSARVGTREIRLASDPTQDTHDRYGRMLAYVYLADGTLINEVMVEEGYAREYTFLYPYTLQSSFKAAELRAQSGAKGIWSLTCSR